MKHEENDPEDIPIFAVEMDSSGLYHIVCNKTGFLVIDEYLQSYASDANEKDQHNPYAQ